MKINTVGHKDWGHCSILARIPGSVFNIDIARNYNKRDL